jgi:hypothetical protein
LWTYSNYKAIAGRNVPTIITRNRYKAGLNISSDDQTKWSLKESFEETKDVLSESSYLSSNTNVYDYRFLPETYAFTYHSSEGSLEEQSSAARQKQGFKTPSASTTGSSNTIPIFVAILGVGIGVAAIRRLAKNRPQVNTK